MKFVRSLSIRWRLAVSHLAVLLVALTAGVAFTGTMPGLAATAVGLVGAGVLGATVAISIVRPIEELASRLAEPMGPDGEVAPLRDRTTDEVARLTRSFNEALARRGAQSRDTGPVAGLVEDPAQRSTVDLFVHLGRVVALSDDFGDAAHTVLAAANEFLRLDWSSILVLDSAGTGMLLGATAGIDPVLTEEVRRGARPVAQFKPGQGISGEVFETGRPLIVNRGHRDKRFKHFPRFAYNAKKINNLACVPLMLDGNVVGLANFVNVQAGSFGEEHVVFLAKVSEVLAALLAKTSRYETAFRESLTGLYSPGYFRHLFSLECERIKRRAGSLSVVKLSVDFASGVTDRAVMHDVYRRVGQALRSSFRRLDPCTRIDNHFLIALPSTDPLGALFTAGRVKERIDEFGYDDKERPVFTTSGGVASYPENVVEPTGLLDAVDQALQDAIKVGDCRVVCHKAGPGKGSPRSSATGGQRGRPTSPARAPSTGSV